MFRSFFRKVADLPIQYWLVLILSLALGILSAWFTPWSSDYDSSSLSDGELLGGQVFRFFFYLMILISVITFISAVLLPSRFHDKRVQALGNQFIATMVALWVIIVALGPAVKNQEFLYDGFWALPFAVVILVAHPVCELAVEICLPVKKAREKPREAQVA